MRNLLTVLAGASVALVASVVSTANCGGGGNSTPTTPTPAAVSGATIVINSQGAVSPKQVQISVGQGVTFVNQDSRVHDMESDPHPAHTDCPPANSIGPLSPGQSKTSAAFTAARTCGFHDHTSAAEELKGSIVIR